MRAARRPVFGRVRVTKFIAQIGSYFWTGATLTWIEADGQSFVTISRDGAIVALVRIDASAQGIDHT